MSYEENCRELQKAFTKEQFAQVFNYEYNELSLEFLGFVEQYKALAGIIPKEFTIIDFGCNAAPQMYYFRNHHKYIGIEATDCICFSQPNAEIHTKTTIQDFIKSMKRSCVSSGIIYPAAKNIKSILDFSTKLFNSITIGSYCVIQRINIFTNSIILFYFTTCFTLTLDSPGIGGTSGGAGDFSGLGSTTFFPRSSFFASSRSFSEFFFFVLLRSSPD